MCHHQLISENVVRNCIGFNYLILERLHKTANWGWRQALNHKNKKEKRVKVWMALLVSSVMLLQLLNFLPMFLTLCRQVGK